MMLSLAWSLILLCFQSLCIQITLARDHNVMNYFECFASLFEEIIKSLRDYQ